jgi:nucleoside-diphosphate-sugar epimerase
MKKILVTGASGFVGSALCQTLITRGWPVTGSVRVKSAPFHYASGALSASTDWSGALNDCACVIHLAARVHVMKEAAADALAAYRAVNVDATMHLARQAAACGVRRFIFVSSIKVNGEASGKHPFRASDAPAPCDPYGQSKMEAEQQLQAFAATSGMELVIVRPPLVYGPGVRANFQRLMELIKSGWPLPFGAVGNQRSMVALDNLIDLLLLCCTHPKAPGAVLLVSDDHDVSTAELIRMLAAPMGRRARLLAVPTSLMRVAAAAIGKSAQADRVLGSLQIDVAPTKRLLDWHPPVAMQAALDQTVIHFLNHIKS